jgi:superfamily II DNA/RNA helicase
MKSFDGFGLDPILNKSLVYMKYTKPTPIQARVIPIALKGRDIIGTAQTGTGKTAAFAIPIVERLMNDPEASALVLTPTRELGKQILDIMHMLLGRKSGVRTAFIIGGASMSKQIQKLKERPRLVVGTPGRINDHLKRKTLKLHTTSFVVLDETDRMLDMGFSVQLDKIFEYLPEKRQTLMFSATLPGNIQKMAQKYLNDPERIAVGSTRDPAKNIEQQVIRVTDKEKYPELLHQLEARKGTVIIFVKTKYNTERLAKKLNNEGHSADAIHGDLKQSRRERVLKSFRDKKYRILVATDVAARGLDIPHIEHVINYDLPQVPEDYIHRIGRTARAGAKGQALCLVTDRDGRKWHAIELLINPDKTEITQDNVKPKPKTNNKPKNKLDNKSNKKKKRRNRRRVKNKKKNYQSRPKKKAA